MLIDDSRGPEPQCRAATRRSPTCLSGRRVEGKEGRDVKVAKWNDNETSCACICVLHVHARSAIYLTVIRSNATQKHRHRFYTKTGNNT